MINGFPVPISVPPQDASNHLNVAPDPPTADKLIVPASFVHKLFHYCLLIREQQALQ
jgi:hypothetical protein